MVPAHRVVVLPLAVSDVRFDQHRIAELDGVFEPFEQREGGVRRAGCVAVLAAARADPREVQVDENTFLHRGIFSECMHGLLDDGLRLDHIAQSNQAFGKLAQSGRPLGCGVRHVSQRGPKVIGRGAMVGALQRKRAQL
jgi:hypothetical protein